MSELVILCFLCGLCFEESLVLVSLNEILKIGKLHSWLKSTEVSGSGFIFSVSVITLNECKTKINLHRPS